MLNKKEDCLKLGPYLQTTVYMFWHPNGFMFLTRVTHWNERRPYCLISEPDILSQLPSQDHKKGPSLTSDSKLLPCIEGSQVTVCKSLGLFISHPEHLKAPQIQYVGIISLLLQGSCSLTWSWRKRNMIGHIHVHISVCRAVNKHECCCESVMGLFAKMKQARIKTVPYWILVAPQLFGVQMVLFQWILVEPYQGNLLTTPNPLQPPAKFLCGHWWGWHTVWANSVCPRKQGVFDVHK